MGILEGKATKTDATGLSEAKALLRNRMRDIRAGIDPDWAAEAGAAACSALVRLPVFAAASVVGLYRPQPGEVPVDGLETALRRSFRTVVLPAWDSTHTRYTWSVWDPDTPLVPGPWGILQPDRGPPGAPPPELAVAPGLAFDAQGRRLGHGRGHFDRLLTDARMVRVGLAFARQIVDRVPAGPHDVAMDWMVTEKNAWGTSSSPADTPARPVPNAGSPPFSPKEKSKTNREKKGA